MANKDLYKILDVEKNIDEKELKRAFKKMAKKYHPDISKEENAEEKFKEIQDAYAILSDSQKRSTYDQYGYDAFQDNQGHSYDSSGFDFSDIFSEIFGGGFGGRQRTQRQNRSINGNDMQMGITLSFKESIFGCEKEFNLNIEEDCHTCHATGADGKENLNVCQNCHGTGVERVQQRGMFGMIMTERICSKCNGQGQTILKKCPDCKGSGRKNYNKDLKVTFPAGVENGAHMRIPGYGEGGYKEGHSGDLYIYVEVKEDKYFSREGKNIKIEMPVSYATLVLGGKIEVPTINGKVDLKIPAGTNTHTILRMKGKGIQSNKQGDQLVKLILKTPNKISKNEKELIQKLSKLNENKVEQGVFDTLKSWF